MALIKRNHSCSILAKTSQRKWQYYSDKLNIGQIIQILSSDGAADRKVKLHQILCFRHFLAKRSIKICQCHVLLNITCIYCKKLYIGETGRQLGDRFQEHPCNVERNEMTRTYPNQLLDTLTSLIVLSSIWQFGSFPYIWAVQRATKLLEQKLIFKSALLIPTLSMSAFH